MAKSISTSLHVPYIKLDLSIGPILEFLDIYLNMRNSSDVAIVLEDQKCNNPAQSWNSYILYLF